MTSAPITVTLKHTLSAKQRAEGGDEVFISVGQEVHNVPVDQEDEYKAKLGESLAAWLEDRVGTVAAATFEGYAEPEEGEAEPEDEEETEGEGGEDELTLEDVEKMKLPELKALVAEYELEADPKLKLKELRAAIIEELFAEGEEEGGEEEETEEGEEEGEEEAGYDEEELKGMKLAELVEIADAWEIEVSVPKGAGLKDKKALYIEAILEEQEG